MEQLMMTQSQLLQQMTQNIKSNNQNKNVNAPPQVRDKRGEFLKGHPPVFKHSADPLQADDWLRAVERQLEIAQCDDREKVLYATRQLQGAPLDWWESFRFGRTEVNSISWQEFCNAFHSHHVPSGLMKLKKKEFLALKQEDMSVVEYHDKFVQLSRYAPTEVENDNKKQELFLEGLNDGIQYQLLSHTFASFQHLVDKALIVENKCREIENKKRKFQGQQSRRNGRVHSATSQAYTSDNSGNPNATNALGNQVCYVCGEIGHYSYSCPVKIAQIVQERQNCKASQNLGNGRQQSYVYGKDNHIIAESVQETPDMIIEKDYLDTTPDELQGMLVSVCYFLEEL
jgi:hypothetical protein